MLESYSSNPFTGCTAHAPLKIKSPTPFNGYTAHNVLEAKGSTTQALSTSCTAHAPLRLYSPTPFDGYAAHNLLNNHSLYSPDPFRDCTARTPLRAIQPGPSPAAHNPLRRPAATFLSPKPRDPCFEALRFKPVLHTRSPGRRSRGQRDGGSFRR